MTWMVSVSQVGYRVSVHLGEMDAESGALFHGFLLPMHIR